MARRRRTRTIRARVGIPRRALRQRLGATRRRATRRGGFLTGKGMLNNVIGAIGILAAKKVVGENSMLRISVGSYNPAVQKIAAGFGLKAVGMDNSDLISAGLKEGLATVIDNYTSGRGLGLGRVVGGNGGNGGTNLGERAL